MNRKLLVTLLHKNIEELNVITEGFMEMDEYPAAIIHLAKRKTEDIQIIIDELADGKTEQSTISMPYINVNQQEEQSNIKLTKSTETAIVDEQKVLISENNTIEELETENLTVKVEIVEPEINIPAVENLEESLNPELILEDPEIENLPELLVEPVTEKPSETFFQQQDEIIIVEDVQEIESSVITSTDVNERKATTEEHKKTIIAERIITPTVSRNETLAKGDNSLSASIANKKITDIKQAISIGDRFRFQRELFKGNGEEMNRTLNYINQLATFDEASSFLMSKYGWDKANENVHDFLQLVRRRF